MLYSFIENLARLLHRTGAVLTLLVAALVLLDVIRRNFFGQPFFGTPELVANTMLILVFLQVPYVLISRRLLRVSAIVDRMPVKVGQLSEAMGYLLGAVFFLVLVTFSWNPLIRGLASGEYFGNVMFRIPAWSIRIPAMALWAVCLVCCLVMALRSLKGQAARSAREVRPGMAREG